MAVQTFRGSDVRPLVRSAVLVTLLLTVACGVVYPLVLTGLGQVLFPDQANGSLVRDGSGNVIGSRLIAQSFAVARYFHPRPSAAGSNGYDPTSSGASNLGPTNPNLADQVRQRAAAYRQRTDWRTIRRCRWMRSQRRPAGSTPTSVRPMPPCRSRGSLRPAASRRPRSRRSFSRTPRVVCSESSASLA